MLQDGSDPTPENILLAADHIRMESDLHFLVVDPYLYLDLKVGNRENETMGIKRMLTTFQLWGRQHGVWIIIVAHPRKLNKISGSNDLEEIDKYTIGGSAHWANIADFILSLRRIRKGADDTPAGCPLDYTELRMLKVRDQTQCTTGTVLYTRQPCGRYDERPDLDAIIAEHHGHPLPADLHPWR